jgi:RNA polymerase sigma factor (sigma-70 family)
MGGALRAVMRCVRRLADRDGARASDAELLARYVGGDGAAFELLLWRHGPMVLGVCRRVLRHVQDAEDVFQTVFLTLARKAGAIGRGEAVSGWLYRVGYREALRARSAAARLPARLPAGTDVAAPEADDVEWRDLRPVLDEEVNRLPDKYRTPIILCYLQGKTQEEAALLLGCPKGTVAVRLMRARRRLQDQLTRRGVALTLAAGAATLAGRACAAPPPELIDAVLRTAPSGPGLGAAPAAPLLKRGSSMFLTKPKVAAAVLLVVGAVGASLSWAVAHRDGPVVNPSPDPPADRAEEVPAQAKAPEKTEPPGEPEPASLCEVPCERDGTLLFVGTECKPGELLPFEPEWSKKMLEGKISAQEIRFLAVELAPGDTAPPKGEEVFLNGPDGKPDGKRYRRWKAGDKLEPGRLKFVTETRCFRRLEVGDRVKMGDLLAMINPAQAEDDVLVRAAKLERSESVMLASLMTRRDVEHRYYRDRFLRASGKDKTPPSEDITHGAELAWQRYSEEVMAKTTAIAEARFELNQSITAYKTHEIRSISAGVVRSIDKHAGEGVRMLDRVLLLEETTAR